MISLKKIRDIVNNQKKVSILMPLYNKKDYVISSIESVINQTYSKWELIIIDDNSTDGSYDIVNKYISNIGRDIKLFKNINNYGPYVLLNFGINMSEGEYICRLDADDTLNRNTLQLCVDILNNNNKFDIVQYKYQRENSNRQTYGEICLFYKKTIIDKIGYYDSVRYAADTEFLFRARKSCSIHRLNKLLYNASYVENSLTTSQATRLGNNSRKIYIKNLNNWYKKSNKLYIEFPLYERPFDAPCDMVVIKPSLKSIFLSFPGNINQGYVSKALSHFKERFILKYNLKSYDDNKLDTIFFGMYSDQDIEYIKNHEGKKYLLWGGTDCNYKYSYRAKMLSSISEIPNIIHLSSSEDIYDRLLRFNISSYRIVLNMVDTRLFYPRPSKGNKIYIYNGYTKGNEQLYGKKYYEEVIKRLPEYSYIYSNQLNHKYEQMADIYSECFIGLRLTDHDGNANTVQEFEAMDIPIVHNQSEYGLKWKNVDDIIGYIKYYC